MNKWTNINNLIKNIPEIVNGSDEIEDILFYLNDWKRLKKIELEKEVEE